MFTPPNSTNNLSHDTLMEKNLYCTCPMTHTHTLHLSPNGSTNWVELFTIIIETFWLYTISKCRKQKLIYNHYFTFIKKQNANLKENKMLCLQHMLFVT